MKKHIIIDTDTNNEADDQFALAYLIRSQDLFNIDAITIAPYAHHRLRVVNVWESQELSYAEAKKICKFLNFDSSIIYYGSNDYLDNDCKKTNDAVEKIIEIAHKNKKTTILAIAALTNIALALIKDPSIANKIEIIWLGGHELGYKNNLEYNFKHDIKAVQTVFASNVKLTILPCNNVVSSLKISLNELKSNIENKSPLCNYLIEKFSNDGYHGFTNDRIIWDIAVVAYAINKKWFKKTTVAAPKLEEDTSYTKAKNERKITFATSVDRDSIYKDLFKRLTLESLIINYSDQEVIKNQKSIFLAGPTPRGKETISWRKEACRVLEENGFDGIVYVPEYSTWKPKEDYVEQAEWEREALLNASVIVFWIPRELPENPAFTTNVEFGYWLHTGKVLYGRPNNAQKIKYLDWLYKIDTNNKLYTNLQELLLASIKKANEVGINKKNKLLPLEKRKIVK